SNCCCRNTGSFTRTFLHTVSCRRSNSFHSGIYLSGATQRDTNMVKKSVYTLDEVMTAGEEISSIEELENVLLEQVQQAQEIIVLSEEEDYDEAREQVEAIEGKLNAIRRFIESLEGDEPSDDDTE